MELENKDQKEIQQAIFSEIQKGTPVETIKNELREKGLHPEAYYFTTESQHNVVMDAPSSSSNVSGWQVFLVIVSLLVLVIRIARCSNRM